MIVRLTGSSPFYGKTYNEILQKNKKCEIKFNFEGEKCKPSELGSLNDKFINNFLAVDLLRKMLDKNPENRISANDCLNH